MNAKNNLYCSGNTAEINAKKPTCSNILTDLLPLNEPDHKYRDIGKKNSGVVPHVG